ncbi:transglycosylase domain-containing protein [Pseudomonadales bacterium]|nr:transglycosylase domain-containing protein [Pseudomonadales bacterium]
MSHLVLGENGETLATRLSYDGYWREPVKLADIDSRLVDVLIAYEDKRFWRHPGVDLLAVFRAIREGLLSGDVNSGASTLTMQTARLLYPGLAKKTLFTKLNQMLMALRLEYHWSKQEILEAYFTLAPYGGNVEGIRAGSQLWLNRLPQHLTFREAAFFVAMPQSPEARRPDRYPVIAEESTSRVLAAVAETLHISSEQLVEYQSESIPLRITPRHSGYSHLVDRLSSPKGGILTTHLNDEWQTLSSAVLNRHIYGLPDSYNGALLIVERETGSVKAYVASTDYQNVARKGSINYLNVLRSPGSTLKPLIYGLALGRTLLTPSSVMIDSEIQISGYTPTNFNEKFHGQVLLRDALIQSLNIPAINTLDRLGAATVAHQLQRFLDLPMTQMRDAGLSLVVGGQYLTAEQLVNLYLGIVSQPSPKLKFLKAHDAKFQEPLLSQKTSAQLMGLLAQVDLAGRPYIVKTGTSNGRHDAWSVHITNKHILLVWVGSPDNKTNIFLSGVDVATPIGNDVIDALDLKAPDVEIFHSKSSMKSPLRAERCRRLIEYPENDEWIISDNKYLSVASKYNDIVWYLNGSQVDTVDGLIKLEYVGANILSARREGCITTHSIYIQQLRTESQPDEIKLID